MTGIPISWIDVIYSNYPLVGQYFTLYAEQLMDFGLELVQVNLYFRQKSDGSMYMELMPLFYFPDNSLYGASYNFDMAMPEPGVLRLGNYTCPFDANGFNTTFLEAGAGKELLDALAGQARNGLVRHVEFHIRRKDSDNYLAVQVESFVGHRGLSGS